MSVVIGCDSFLALRNVRNGNLGRWLESHRVLVWVDPHQFEGSRVVKPEGVELGCLEEFDARYDPYLNALLAKSSLARRCYYDPTTRWVKFKRSSHRRNRHKPIQRTASVSRAGAMLAAYWIAGRAGLAQHWDQQFGNTLRQHPVVKVYRRRLEKVGATVVAGFSPEGIREMALVEAANSLSIPTAIMIRSRDNLAAKIAYLPYAEAYFVWSEITRQFLLRMYPEIQAEHVHVLGSPQFDRHLDPAYFLERETFFSLIGLDSSRPLVVYTMATPGLIEHEIEIAQHLADAAHGGAFVGGAQLLVRGHPRMFGANVKLLHKEYPEACSYPRVTNVSYRSPEHEAQVVRHILEDEPIHLATLAYQDVQVNVCGTMTIDSAIFDKPTVNVYYDLVKGVPHGLSVRRFYERSDVSQMMSYKASRLAHSPEECIKLVNRYLEEPTLDGEGRRLAREGDCGPLDGLAGKRIAEALTALEQKKTQLLRQV